MKRFERSTEQAAAKSLIHLALGEDIGPGDCTSEAILSPTLQGRTVIVAKEAAVICGLPICKQVFLEVDQAVMFEPQVQEGESVAAQTIVARVSGSLVSIFSAERVALNFLQRLSGIATSTRKFVSQVQKTKVQIRDTRKTTPGWRSFEKYAVKTGGGVNHRFGLFDAILIKSNHIDASGESIIEAIRRARAQGALPVQVEVRNITELREALSASPDSVLLDNMSVEEVTSCVAEVRSTPRCESLFIEASGGITEATITEYAKTGIDAVAVGMLTHSVKAIDLSLRLEKVSSSRS